METLTTRDLNIVQNIIDTEQPKLEKKYKEMMSAIVDMKKVGEETELGKILKERVDNITKEYNAINSYIERLNNWITKEVIEHSYPGREKLYSKSVMQNSDTIKEKSENNKYNMTNDSALYEEAKINDEEYEDEVEELENNRYNMTSDSTLYEEVSINEEEYEDEEESENNMYNMTSDSTLYEEANINEEECEDEVEELENNRYNMTSDSTLYEEANINDEEYEEEYEEIYEDDLFDDIDEEEKNKMIDNLRIIYRKNRYKVTYDLHKKGCAIPMSKDWCLEKGTLSEKMKNNAKKLNENMDVNVYLALYYLDKTYNTNYVENYRNGKLDAEVEYDLSDIMSSKKLGITSKIKQYKTALKQEEIFGSKVIHSNNILLKLLLKVDDKISSKNSSKTENEKSNTKILKNKNANENKFKINNLVFKKIKPEYIAIGSLGCLLLGVVSAKSINIVHNNLTQAKEVGEVVTSTSVVQSIQQFNSKIPNDVQEKAEKARQEKIKKSEASGMGVNDKLSLVQKNDDGTVIKDFKLSKDEFGSGDKYSASSIDGDSFVVSSLTVYNKDNNEIIDTIKTDEIKTNELYGKYGADIEISLGFDTYDKDGKLVSENVGYLNIDDFASFSDETKQRLAEAYSKEYASATEEVKEEKTENKTSNTSTEATTELTTENKTTEKSTETKKSEEEKKEVATKTEKSNTNDDNEALLVYKDNDGNITKACTWTEYSNGTGKKGSATCLDCDSYKFSWLTAYNGTQIFDVIKVSGYTNSEIEDLCNKLYDKYGDTIDIAYNFNGYTKGKKTDTNLGWINKKEYDSFNSERGNNLSAMNNSMNKQKVLVYADVCNDSIKLTF